MEAFREVLNDRQLVDLGYFGPWFTWEKRNLKATNIRERLDSLLGLFLKVKIWYLPHTYFDH